MAGNLISKLMDYIWERSFKPRARNLVKDVLINEKLVFGAYGNLTIGNETHVNNAFFNLSSGDIKVGNNVSFGHSVYIITGTHDVNTFGIERQWDYPKEGRDIIIEDGVWIGSNVTILGPCIIGKNAAVAAHSLVNKDIPEQTLYGGVPAKFLRSIN
jgi:acetyltransferase-like isoleucine patch superfamily enzyme